MTIPQFQAMPAADKSRKLNLINYGFRLPSALDHRPLFWQELEYILGLQDLPQNLQDKTISKISSKSPNLLDLYNEIIQIESNLLDNQMDFNFQLEPVLEALNKSKKKKVYVLFVSATPAEYEIKISNNTIVEQIIRPTGLLDPITYIYPKS
jgi:excinuclease ABC subunit B